MADQTVYDRGVADGGAHQRVDPKIYSSQNVGLPTPEEIPGCALEVQNYHIPPVGSFHQKTVIVDREVALLSSNNVQNQVSPGSVRLRRWRRSSFKSWRP